MYFRVAILTLCASVSLMLATSVVSAAQPGIACVQNQMNALGFDAGPADGSIGPKTRAATEAYRAWMKTNAEPGWAQPALNATNGVFWCEKVGQAHSKVAKYATSEPEQCNLQLGQWKWFRFGDVEFRADGSVYRQSREARWTCSQDVVTIRWIEGGYVDTLVLSRAGKRLSGKNQHGNDIWGTWKSN